MDPEDYHHPINHAWAYAQGWSMEQLMAETGRTYTQPQVYLNRDDADIAREIQDVSCARACRFTRAFGLVVELGPVLATWATRHSIA